LPGRRGSAKGEDPAAYIKRTQAREKATSQGAGHLRRRIVGKEEMIWGSARKISLLLILRVREEIGWSSTHAYRNFSIKKRGVGKFSHLETRWRTKVRVNRIR